MTATPEQRRRAWTELVSQMEGRLVATRENARLMVKREMADQHTRPLRLPGEWDATAWAADRLLKDLAGLAPPVVPVDNERGQLSLVDPESGEDHPPCCTSCGGLGGASDGPCWDCRGTGHSHPLPAPELEDDGRKVHWLAEGGAMVHPLHNLSRPPKTSGDEEDVTCQRCLHFLSQASSTPGENPGEEPQPGVPTVVPPHLIDPPEPKTLHRPFPRSPGSW